MEALCAAPGARLGAPPQLRRCARHNAAGARLHRCSAPASRLADAPALAPAPGRRAAAAPCRAAASPAGGVERSINPRVASLNESKTMALTDLARAMKEAGKPVRPRE
jgi:hypothetical protein